MSTGNQALRKPQVVKPITKEIVVDVTGFTQTDNAIGLTVPAGKFVTGAYISNPANDLAGTGATIAVKVGTTAVVSATAITSIKNTGVGAIDASPDYSATARTVYLTVATANLTAGTCVVKVTYI